MKQKGTTNKSLNIFWGIFFIVLFLYYIYLTFTLDQQSYLSNHKSVAKQESVTAVIRDFKTHASSSRYYS
ncbi:MAG: hypothetical protein RR238_10670, partial [Lachnospiraceae bacterium]